MSLNLRASLFWDVDIQNIDLQKHKASVIERIAMRGQWEEFNAMLYFYGKPTVKRVISTPRCFP